MRLLTPPAVSSAILAAGLATCIGCQTSPKNRAAPPPAAEGASVRVVELEQSSSNLRRVHEAIAMYQNANDCKLPPNLGATLNYCITARNSSGERADPTPSEAAAWYLAPKALEVTPVPAQPTPEWVNRNTSYVYLPNERVVDDKVPQWDKTVLAHERLDTPGRTLVAVLMLDGHVEVMNLDRAAAMIAESKRKFQAAQALAGG